MSVQKVKIANRCVIKTVFVFIKESAFLKCEILGNIFIRSPWWSVFIFNLFLFYFHLLNWNPIKKKVSSNWQKLYATYKVNLSNLNKMINIFDGHFRTFYVFLSIIPPGNIGFILFSFFEKSILCLKLTKLSST